MSEKVFVGISVVGNSVCRDLAFGKMDGNRKAHGSNLKIASYNLFAISLQKDVRDYPTRLVRGCPTGLFYQKC